MVSRTSGIASNIAIGISLATAISTGLLLSNTRTVDLERETNSTHWSNDPILREAQIKAAVEAGVNRKITDGAFTK